MISCCQAYVIQILRGGQAELVWNLVEVALRDEGACSRPLSIFIKARAADQLCNMKQNRGGSLLTSNICGRFAGAEVATDEEGTKAEIIPGVL